jgi:hypothetical protein
MSRTLVEDNKDNRISELDFSVDGFHNQKVLRGVDAYAQMFKRLLLMKKGTYPSVPDCGVDLGSYRFADIDSLVGGTLRNTIENQVNRYLPLMPLKNITISKTWYKGDYVLFITAEITNDTKLTAGFLQRKRSIISSKITVDTPKYINTKGSD